MSNDEALATRYAAAVGAGTGELKTQRFTEITDIDESACDGWIGLISCGHTDRSTLLRAWFCRRNFGRLASAADMSITTIGAKVPIGGGFADLHAPVMGAGQLCVAYALAEAGDHNFTQALDVLAEVEPSDMASWAVACVYGAGQRWDMVLDTLNGRTWGQDPVTKIFAPCAELLRGVAAAHLGLWAEAQRRIEAAALDDLGKAAVARCAAWYLAMIYRQGGEEALARNQLEWLNANFAEPKAEHALADPQVRLAVTTRAEIAARSDVWDPRSVAAANDSDRRQRLDDAQAALDATIGLAQVKEQVADVWASSRMMKLREERGMSVGGTSRHMVFAGPPGTGKTSIARVITDIYYGLGLIKKPDVVEKNGLDLIGRYLGDTPKITTAIIDSALDGVLFVDEAYAIVTPGPEGSNKYGEEAINTLLARMENDRDRLVVIVAGYPDDMDRFLDANQGLRSRFATRITFDGYHPDEIVEITEHIASHNNSSLTSQAAAALQQSATHLADTQLPDHRGVLRPGLDVAGHGRYARNIFEAAERARDRRLDQLNIDNAEITDDMLTQIHHSDMITAIKKVSDTLSAPA